MWIVCQIGARENYAVARALHEGGQLGVVITDFWVPPDHLISRLPGNQRLAQRYHAGIKGAMVAASNPEFLLFEASQRLLKRRGWEVIVRRNRMFQNMAIRRIRSKCESLEEPITLFSYSYAALQLFRYARTRGWKTVLGQIDPGPQEERLVTEIRKNVLGFDSACPPAPESYWIEWREEISLADEVWANSEWSRECLLAEGVPGEKIRVVPLVFESDEDSKPGSHQISVPLRVLFLGQAIVRKGIHDLVKAAILVDGHPIQIDVVGSCENVPSNLPENIRFHGSVSRGETGGWYSSSSLFVLPTYSDGFALTQLEAMAHGLPVIATPRCGDVVVHGVNGWLVPEGDPGALARLLIEIAGNPSLLESMREAAIATVNRFGIDSLMDSLKRSY